MQRIPGGEGAPEAVVPHPPARPRLIDASAWAAKTSLGRVHRRSALQSRVDAAYAAYVTKARGLPADSPDVKREAYALLTRRHFELVGQSCCRDRPHSRAQDLDDLEKSVGTAHLRLLSLLT